LGLTWAVVPVVYGLGWCLRALPGHKKAQFFDQWLMANFWSHGVLFWVWVMLVSLISLIIIWVTSEDGPSKGHATGPIIATILAIVLAGSFIQVIRVGIHTSKAKGDYYSKSVVFDTPSLSDASAPPSLSRLLNSAQPGDGKRCDKVGSADVSSCIKQATLPTNGWDARVSSLDGAVYALSRSSGTVQNVSLNKSTVNYLNSWHGQPARWSGVLDGTGNGQGMGGIAEWNGTKVSTCSFSGSYAIGRSFGGSNMADLSDLLAEKYSGLRWKISDVWGYCDGNQPIVVVPMTRQIYYQNRTVDTAAGIVTIQGDHGKTRLTYQSTVKAGSVPGPVYPSSLVDTQLNEGASWAAGRRAHDDYNFGYEPTTSGAQAGNVKDYLLRNSKTGQLEWVTPLTLRGSSSQLFVAYAISDAGTVTGGSLNPLSIYVLGSQDSRVINVDSMEAAARNWLTNQKPGFISSGGKLVEFIPKGGDQWQAYGELSGRVIYVMDFNAQNKTAPTLTDISGEDAGSGSSGTSSSPPTSGSDSTSCGQPPSKLTTAQIASCLQQLSSELAGRETASTASAAPSSK
jgi:hypothetical protein